MKAKNDDFNLEKQPVNKAKVVEDKARDIIKSLQIKPSKDPIIQLQNAMLIHKYIVQNCDYTIEVSQEKAKIVAQGIKTGENIDFIIEELYNEELYNGLIKKRGVCSTDAIVFTYLLSKIGMKGDVVLLEKKDGHTKHATTLVEIGTKKYYFETNLERKIFEEQQGKRENFGYYCARIGQ